MLLAVYSQGQKPSVNTLWFLHHMNTVSSFHSNSTSELVFFVFKTESIILGNWVIWISSGQKPCTRIISSTLLFEGYKCSKFYEITPRKRFLWKPKKTNLELLKASNISQNEILRMTIYLCFLRSCKVWNLFSQAPMRNCLGVIKTDN